MDIVTNGNGTWYALYTKSRHEKIVEARLMDKGIKTFLPIREVISQWKDRKKRIYMPLFPSYLFISIGLENIHKAIYTPGVLRVLGTNGTPVPVPTDQINSVRTLVEKTLKYDPHPYLTKGRKIAIKSGPLEGVIGRIIEKRGKHRLVVSIDLIKRSVSVEVDIKDVEPV